MTNIEYWIVSSNLPKFPLSILPRAMTIINLNSIKRRHTNMLKNGWLLVKNYIKNLMIKYEQRY